MILNLKLIRVDYKYCDYLRKFDSRVAYNKATKELRPYIGILFTIRNCEYFAPLSSPKSKHLKMKNNYDFFKIDGGKLGVVNFNNMIPVTNKNYEVVDFKIVLNDLADKQYQSLLREQLDWLNKNYIQVKNKAYKLYDMYETGKLNQNIMSRCCNFLLLEEKCSKYNNELVTS